MLVLKGSSLKAASHNEREKKRLENIHHAWVQSKDKCCMSGSRTVFQKPTTASSVNLPFLIVIVITSFRDLIYQRLCCPPYICLLCTPVSHNRLEMSAFCSTVAVQIKPWEEVVGLNVTTRPRLKAKSGRSCTILWWKRPYLCWAHLC